MNYVSVNQDTAKKTASELIEVSAVKISPSKPFVWASGWNSPIYCDNRITLSYPNTRTYLKNALVETIRNNFPEVEAIAGVATAGIPQGALVADILDLPFLYIRSKPKGHGMKNMIEGKVDKKQKVVLVEDLVSTGGSSLKAAEALKEAGAEILGMVSIFTYGFEIAENNFKEAGIKLVSLSDYSAMLNEALNRGLVKENELISLKSWRTDPENWKA
ncbi:orotate phosphoribosyltransferase [Marinigracilibium pacificum]|uniref:Orotate phosphoribosyltransferase n=1 Tax=Marinigracilibium pacificum TaxID=2729599 RepID=A0A848J4A0_9BACT|nr:orotate phosphoribosyltransferase [Marinigracilibium pacificum]NMM50546.1 orotate phosphoribosyltransferase [Marinigracilibium pacificum]